MKNRKCHIVVLSNLVAFLLQVFKLKLLFTIIALSFFTNIYSQPENFHFASITKQQGLPDNTIYHIYQDRTGFIWLCTGTGLVRYDGNNFKQFFKNKTVGKRSVNSIRVSHIMQDRSGKFWISTSDNGINVYDPENEIYTYYRHDNKDSNSVGNDNINNCFQDSKGRMWICTLGSGLDLFDPIKQSFTHYIHSETDSCSIPNDHVTSIAEDAYGKLWLALNGNYICQFDPTTGKSLKFKTTYSNVNLGGYNKKLYFTSADTLWITTEGTGLFNFNIKTHVFERFYQDFKPGSMNSNNVKGIVSDNTGKLLIITDGGGINIIDTKTKKISCLTYESNIRNGLTSNALYSILRDNKNNLWIGTYKGGLLLLKENTRTINVVAENSQNNGLCHKSVLCILKDSEGITWYGTDGGGLTSFNPKTRKYTCYQFDPNNQNSISNNVVKAIYEDKDGYLWIATFFGGLNRFDKKTQQFKHYLNNSSVSKSMCSANSWCILEDLQENLWVGNFSRGLEFFNKKTETFLLIPQEYGDSTTLSHTQVSSLIQDVQGNIWVGTLRGLNQMDPKTFKCRRFFHNDTDSNSLSDDLITCLFYDSKNRLWIGSDNGGLNLMIKPGVFKSFGENGELPSLAIQSIQEDNFGNLWISTKNGLVKFNPTTNLFFNMDDIDDLISNEFNWNSSAKDSEGNLYYGSIDGVCVFNPDKIEFHKAFPDLIFTEIKAFNKNIEVGEKYHGRVLLEKSVTYGGNVTLTAQENAFTIDFTAVEFNKPSKIKYKYKLKGFDKDWVYTDALQRNATYTNLSGGNYTFHLSSTNSAGIWNDESISLNITIIPPFYKQWWFRLFIALVVALIGLIFYRRNIEKHRTKIREAALTREKELIERRNAELKSEIASNTILLLNKNESLEQIKSKLNELKPHSEENNIKINELIGLVDNQMDADVYWEQFQYNFDQVYMNLLSRLKAKYPDLSRTNLKLCAYLRLNMSSKEIASLMNITLSGIDKSRNRLRKKLNILPNDDLSEFLMSF